MTSDRLTDADLDGIEDYYRLYPHGTVRRMVAELRRQRAGDGGELARALRLIDEESAVKGDSIYSRAADALCAQAARIKELEAAIQTLSEAVPAQAEVCDKARHLLEVLRVAQPRIDSHAVYADDLYASAKTLRDALGREGSTRSRPRRRVGREGEGNACRLPRRKEGKVADVELHWLSCGGERGFATIGGYKVPYIKIVRYVGGQHDGQLSFVLDVPGATSHGIDVNESDAARWIAFLADAMAAAAGFTSCGPNSRRANPFKVQCHFITTVEKQAPDDEQPDGPGGDINA